MQKGLPIGRDIDVHGLPDRGRLALRGLTCPYSLPRSTIEHMFDKVSYRIEGNGPVTAVLTYQNREYRHTSRTMWLGHEDGMPQGSIQLDEHVWARLQRINGTIEATITDSQTGESYTLTPE